VNNVGGKVGGLSADVCCVLDAAIEGLIPPRVKGVRVNPEEGERVCFQLSSVHVSFGSKLQRWALWQSRGGLRDTDLGGVCVIFCFPRGVTRVSVGFVCRRAEEERGNSV